jgi:hypothetical protein
MSIYGTRDTEAFWRDIILRASVWGGEPPTGPTYACGGTPGCGPDVESEVTMHVQDDDFYCPDAMENWDHADVRKALAAAYQHPELRLPEWAEQRLWKENDPAICNALIEQAEQDAADEYEDVDV